MSVRDYDNARAVDKVVREQTVCQFERSRELITVIEISI
jgi:hypothetical protein